ncbi:MAG: type I glyceraldehyde-3-phosphate dehydrogenase [bacterium]|nr:type I glyceraldehyde-3-phosphate dehydrogenase [bacterium]
MALRVAIFGFGKVGRNVFRVLYRRDDVRVVAINDIADAKSIEYLLRFDSLHGQFEEPVHVQDGFLYAKGQKIPIIDQRDPGEVPWYDYGVDVVVDATGRYRSREELQKHVDGGADRVIMTTPPRDDVDKIYFQGLAKGPIAREHRIISCGSSTSNCTALMLKVLDDAFGVQSAHFTSVHAYTTEQNLIDVPSSIDLRLSRAAVENIVPVQSWTERAIPLLFPHLEGKFSGCKLNVPVPDVSCVDLTVALGTQVGKVDVNEVFRSASNSTMKGLIEYTEQPIVSSDVAGSPSSCTFDSLQTMVVDGSMIKILGWYDQGGGHAHRIVDLIGQLAERGGSAA